jgi:hypothetical protein
MACRVHARQSPRSDPASANHPIDPIDQLDRNHGNRPTRRSVRPALVSTWQDDARTLAARLRRRSLLGASHGEQPMGGRPGAPAGLADKPNLRRVVIGAILVGTVLLLLSMGGAILAAPVLLPLLWWAARTTGRGVRLLGAILAALVVGEVAWAGVYLVVGERQPYIWALPALSAAVTLWLMLVTTSINPRGSARPAR